MYAAFVWIEVSHVLRAMYVHVYVLFSQQSFYTTPFISCCHVVIPAAGAVGDVYPVIICQI